MKNKLQECVSGGLLLLSVFLFGSSATVLAQDDVAESSFESEDLLYIEEFVLAPGRSFNDAVAEMQEWVKGYRETGEYNSVRLYMHHSGPNLALYILLEPKSWQSIQDGQDKFFAANSEVMDQPFNWGGHSDNVLVEVPVE